MLRLTALLAVFVGVSATAWSQGSLADASLEELLNTKVSSVSKKEEKLARTAASVFVIGQEDIRRSGAQTIPDLLRMVPGVEVAQINSHTWAVSIRGFDQHYANKLLVMIDGRSLYASAFAGVYWDQVDLPMRDIERIEVIRGPGASVWGANAVNGVINIITRSSKLTHGGMAEISGSSTGDGGGLAQYGGSAGSSGDVRAYAGSSRFGPMALANGQSDQDAWFRTRGGFRSDWDLTPGDRLTVEGDAFANYTGGLRFHDFQALPADVPFRQEADSTGADFLARWTHTSASGAESAVQMYYDHFRRNDDGQPDIQTTVDVDYQNRFSLGTRHDIVWGAGYRSLTSNLVPGYRTQMTPPIQTDALYSGFFQDEIRLTDRLWFTVGTKLEHNAYTGVELEPSLRLAWMPTDGQTLWASASRAIRQPARTETSSLVDVGSSPLAPGLVQDIQIRGNPWFRPEELRDFEAGYRAQLSRRLAVDADAFLSFYKHLSTFSVGAPTIVPGLVTVVEIPLTYANQMRAVNYGGELSLNVSVTSRWKVTSGLALLYMNLHLAPGATDPYSIPLYTAAPRSTVQVRSAFNVTRRLQWDQTLDWSAASMNNGVPSHLRVDTRLGWRAGETVELSIAGQNLTSPGFMEFGGADLLVGAMAPRRLIGTITWAF